MTPIEDRLLEIAEQHDRRASRLSNRENVADERQASLAIRAALLNIGTLRVERDALLARLARLRETEDKLRVAVEALEFYAGLSPREKNWVVATDALAAIGPLSP